MTLTKVYVANDEGCAWTQICAEEMDFHSAFVLEGTTTEAAEAVPVEGEAEAPEEAAAEETMITKPFCELWAFLPGEEGTLTFAQVRVLNLLDPGLCGSGACGSPLGWAPCSRLGFIIRMPDLIVRVPQGPLHGARPSQ